MEGSAGGGGANPVGGKAGVKEEAGREPLEGEEDVLGGGGGSEGEVVTGGRPQGDWGRGAFEEVGLFNQPGSSPTRARLAGGCAILLCLWLVCCVLWEERKGCDSPTFEKLFTKKELFFFFFFFFGLWRYLSMFHEISKTIR